MVTAGAMTANVAAYLLHVPASRWLGLAGYSEFATLLAAQLVLAVPALALQTVVAREAVHGASVDALRALTRRCAAMVAVVAAALVPAISALLDVGVVATIAALLVAPILVLLAGEQGILQGGNRFRDLAVLLGSAGIARVVPAVIVLAGNGGSSAALAASAVGTAAVAIAARVWTGTTVGVTTESPAATVASVLMAAQVQAALIALSSADLLVARIVLDGDDASLYALGAVATKAAFWLPQAVAVVMYPRMAHPEHSGRAVRSALALLVALGALAVAGVALASPLVPTLVGDAYSPIQGTLWAFALDGACLAVLQGALLSAIAGRRTRFALVAWVGLAVEIALALTVAHSIGQLIAIAVACAAVTTLVASVVALRDVEKATAAPTPSSE